MFYKNLYVQIFNFIQNIIFPPQCFICNTYLDDTKKIKLTKSLLNEDISYVFKKLFNNLICDKCSSKFEIIKKPFCIKCGTPFKNKEIKEHICPLCQRKKTKINIKRAFLLYGGNSKKLIHMLKYQDKSALFYPTSFMLFYLFLNNQEIYNKTDIIIPIPLYISKEKKRGYNQSYQVVRYFEKFNRELKIDKKIDVDIKSLIRTKKTKSQINFKTKDRIKNVQNAFLVTDKKAIKGQNILLVDDVYTTGATAEEAAKTLLKAGAKEVNMLIISKASEYI